MKISTQYQVEHRTASMIHSTRQGVNSVSMLLPGASSSCFTCSSCSCGGVVTKA